MDTEEFLAHFPGHHVYMSQPESGSGDDSLPRHYHNEYADSEEALRKINIRKNWAIYFTVNLLDRSLDPINELNGKPRHRTKKMVTHCRAVFMDADDPRSTPIDDFPITPSLIVNTSPGKYHYYWLINGMTTELELWQQIQNGLIHKYNGDDNSKDLPRVLRIPGYQHNKSATFIVTAQGSGHKYEWSEIVEAFPPESLESVHAKEGASSSSESKTVNEHINDIKTGKDYHGSLTSICHQMKMQNVPNEYIILALKQAMNDCPDDLKAEGRWKSRYNDIERDVFGHSPDELINLPDIIEKEHGYVPMPKPPGLMGELADCALAAANYPRSEIAIVTSIAIISGIAGRKFNISGSGLNTYQTLIARTGSGKDAIPTFINTLFLAVNDIGTGMSFLGTGGFTGKKSIANKLKEVPSQINVISEAGLLMQSTSGDQEGLTATLLNAYGRSGYGMSLLGSSYSKEEDNIPNIISPAISLVSESTPETLIQVLHDKGAMENGSIARQSIFRIFGRRSDINFDAWRATIPDHILDRIKGLMSACMTAQKSHEQPYEAWPIEFGPYEECIREYAKYCNDKHNDLLDIDFNRSIMYSRAFVKYLKYIGLVVAFNTEELVVTGEAISWAEQMIEYEMSGLESFFEGGSSGIYDEIVRNVVGPAIVKCINGKADKSVTQSSLDQRKKGIFPLNGPKQILKNNKQLAGLSSMNGYKPQDGYIKIIDYMITYGFLVDVSTQGKKLMKVTDDFKGMLYDK